MGIIWVALGGALGSVCRYGVGLLAGRLGLGFALPTFAVNATGSFAIGLVLMLLLARGVDPAWRLLLVTGFLGGYTTFSSFAFDALRLIEEGRPAEAALYVAGTTLVGLLACAGGIAVGRTLAG